MAPKKKQYLVSGQRKIDAFFGSANRRTDSSSSRLGDDAANTAASTAPTAHPVSTDARAQQPVGHSAQQRSLLLGTAGNTAVSAPLQACLTTTAAALTAKLENAVGQIAAGQLQPDGRYHLSRTARQAAGDHPQEQMQQRYAAALRKAYLQVERFCSMNEEQRIAATSDITKALLIIAGAGTGKTSTIISRILFLLNQGVLPHLIVVLTFTNKAAEELQTRLHQAMQEARTIAAAAIGNNIEQHQESGHSGLLACTFHSFCYRFLRWYFKACGFNQCPTVWQDKDARQAIRVAMKLADVDKVRTQLSRWLNCGDSWDAIQAAARAQHPELMRKWFAEQREARAKLEAAAAKAKLRAAAAEAKRHKASEPKGTKRKTPAKQPPPLGKGQQQLSFGRQSSGKVPRQDGASDVTSSDASALQEQQQQHPRMEMPPPPPVMHQQHGLQQHGLQQQQQQQQQQQRPEQQQQQQQQAGQQMPQQQGPEQQQVPNEAEQEQQQGHTTEQLGGLKLQQLQVQAKIRLYELLLQNYERLNEDEQQGAPTVAALKGKIAMKEVKRVQKAIDGFKCKGQTPDQGKLVARYAFYQMLLRLCNAVDFNDLLGHVALMLQSHQPILEHLQRQRPYMMVDEYQDCNPQQVLIVELLQAVLKRVTVVGDDAQSIYGFRGAAPNVFPLYKMAFGHVNLVRTLEKNYRSTPQILKVAQAVLAGSGIHPKELIPQASAEGKPPVRLLIVDSEEHEAEVIAKEARRLHDSENVKYGGMAVLFRAFRFGNCKSHTKLQKALTREGVPFVLMRDVSMFERKEVLDVLAYITLALKPDDDAAFMRVINVPNRRLGKKFEEKLMDEQQRLMAAYAEQQQQGLAGRNIQRQQQQDLQERPSFHSIARRLLAEGQVATLHEKPLREFLAVLECLYGAVRGQTPAQAVVTVLQGMPGLLDDIIKQREKNRKRNQGEEPAAPAEEEGAEDEHAEAAEHDTGGDHQQQQQGRLHDSSRAAGAGTGAGSSAAAAAGGFQSARQAFNNQHGHHQQQQCSGDQPNTMSDSCMTVDDSHATAATPDSDADSEAELESESEDGDDSGSAAERPKELVTPALGCLYDEALAFGAKWALENNVAAATAAAGDAAAPPGSQQGTAAAAAADGSQPAGPAEGTAVGVPSLYELMATQVTQLWTAKQLLQSGLPELLVEELFAALGKGSRPLADFHAHIALNPNTEPTAHSKAAKKQKQKEQGPPDALVISTIHAAKGLEYNTLWVPRWVEGFLPAFPRKADLERLQESEVLKFEDDFFKEEQRLAHVALTRPKERLYLTRPVQQYESRRQPYLDEQQHMDDLIDIAMGRQAPSRDEPGPSRFLRLLEPLLQDQAVYREVNLCKDGGVADTAWYDA